MSSIDPVSCTVARSLTTLSSEVFRSLLGDPRFCSQENVKIQYMRQEHEVCS